jgi:hypothetical protein
MQLYDKDFFNAAIMQVTLHPLGLLSAGAYQNFDKDHFYGDALYIVNIIKTLHHEN